MRSTQPVQGVLSAAFLVGLTACSSSLADKNQFKLRNFQDKSIQASHIIYNYCYRGRETDFVTARDFEAGEQTVVARYAFIKKYVPGGPLEQFFKLKGNFEPGNIYEFRYSRDSDAGTATVWIVDAANEQAVTNKATGKLVTEEVVDTPARQKARCDDSTL
jgi:hypothetical protein